MSPEENGQRTLRIRTESFSALKRSIDFAKAITYAPIARIRGSSETSSWIPAGSSIPELPLQLKLLHSTHQKVSSMRLLKTASVLKFQSLPAYENLKPSEYLDMPYAEIKDDVWATVVVVSWRWHRPLPFVLDAGFSPMEHLQLQELQRVLREEESSYQYVWIDFSCIPQETAPATGPSMSEVMRSRLYYAKARRMLVLPKMVQLPEVNNLSPFLRAAALALERMARQQDFRLRHSLVPCSRSDIQCMRAILLGMLPRPRLCKRDYFSRAWTLMERLSRAGRQEKLKSWMSLDVWAGLIADLLWVTARGEEPDMFPWAILRDPHGASIKSGLEVVRMLCVPVERGEQTLQSICDLPETQNLVAELFLEGLKAWHTTLALAEPSPEWLYRYMTEDVLVAFHATDWRDTVWAVYGSFCTGSMEYSNVGAAVAELCRVAGASLTSTQWYSRSYLEPPRGKPAAEGGASGSSADAGKTWQDDGAHQQLYVLLSIQHGLEEDMAIEREAQRHLSRISHAVRDPPRSRDELAVRHSLLPNIKAAMGRHQGSGIVQLCCCRAITDVVRERSTLVRAMGEGLLDSVLLAMQEFLDDLDTVEQALLALHTLARGAVSRHSGSASMAGALAATKAAIKRHRRNPRIAQLCCACLANLTSHRESVSTFRNIDILSDVQGAMARHRGATRLQEHCCDTLRNLIQQCFRSPEEFFAQQGLMADINRLGLGTDLRKAAEHHKGVEPLQSMVVHSLDLIHAWDTAAVVCRTPSSR